MRDNERSTCQNVADVFGLSHGGQELEAGDDNVDVLVLKTVAQERPELANLRTRDDGVTGAGQQQREGELLQCGRVRLEQLRGQKFSGQNSERQLQVIGRTFQILVSGQADLEKKTRPTV